LVFGTVTGAGTGLSAGLSTEASAEVGAGLVSGTGIDTGGVAGSGREVGCWLQPTPVVIMVIPKMSHNVYLDMWIYFRKEIYFEINRG